MAVSKARPDIDASGPMPAAFRHFLLACMGSSFAYQIVSVALGWQIYAMTDNPLDLGLIGLAQFLPMVAFTLFVGHAADRYDRRLIVATCMALEALCAVALAASSLAGAGWVYCAAALLFIAGCASIATVAVPRQPARKEPATLASLFAGIRFIFQRRILQGTLSLDLFCVLLGGAILMSLVLTRHSLRGAIGLQLFAALFVFGLSKSIPRSIVALAVLGAADSVSMVVRGSLVPLHTPDNMLGRVSAVNTLFIGTSNQLGEFESGVTAALMGTVPAAVLGGIGTIAIAGLWMWWFPELRKLRSLH